MKEATFVFSPSFQTYQFNQDHPFNQLRVYLTYDLLQKMKALTEDEIVAPRMATLEELKLVHTADYIQAVQRASEGKLSTAEGERYGLGTEDTPMFAGMHEAASLLVGGTLTAVDQVMLGHSQHALNLGGGLHHDLKGVHLAFVFIMTALWRFNIFKRHMALEFYILIRMLITAMVSSSASMTTQRYVRCPFMKRDATYSLEPDKYRKEATIKAMATLIIFH